METAFPDLVGNRALAARLDGEIRSGKLSHAYILAGPAGSGKHTLALRIAMALSCENRKIPGVPLPCMTCPSCRKILSGNSPDYIRVAKDKGRATLGVEAIRFLREDVLIAPNDTDTKIYVIEDAETMTPQAQNALLLTLEEPPQYVLFLLLAANTENLLETVRSRAPVLRMEPIPPAEIRACLDRAGKTAGIPEAEMSDILAGADGSIGRALELLHPDKRKPLVEECGGIPEVDGRYGEQTGGFVTLSLPARRGGARPACPAQKRRAGAVLLLYPRGSGIRFRSERAGAVGPVPRRNRSA